MKATDIKLVIVMIVAVIASGLCAKKLVAMQATMNRSVTTVDYASKMPIAGFQKFMADIVWMRFLNYAGNNPLTDKNVERYNYYIQRIIALDPDFYDVYEWGVLFLAQEDLEMALKIVDQAQTHPRFASKHKLPLLAGQLLMRPQWMNMYKGGKPDLAVAARAKKYYFDAKNAGDATNSCLNSYIRASAILNENGDPHEMNELREWVAYCKAMPMDGEGGMMGMEMEGIDGMGIMGEELERRLTSQIGYVSEKFVLDPQVSPEMKTKAEALIQETINEFFQSRPFDMETYKPYDSGNMTRFAGSIGKPESGQKYVIELDALEPFAIESLTTRLDKGSAKITVLIDGQAVAGLEAVPVGTTKASAPDFKAVAPKEDAGVKKDDAQGSESAAPALAPSVRKPLLKNKGTKGSVVELQLTDCVDCGQLNFIVKAYVGNY